MSRRFHIARRPGKTARRRQRGASLVEFALVAPLLLFLLMACIEFSVLFWANLSMQFAVREGVRYAITGRNDLSPGPTPQRHLAVMKKIQDSSMGLYDLLNPVISINNGTAMSSSEAWTAGMFGKPGDIIVVRLDCTWPVMTPILRPFFSDGKLRFSVAATMRNEAFS